MSLDFIRRGDVTKGSNLVAPGEAAKVWNRRNSAVGERIGKEPLPTPSRHCGSKARRCRRSRGRIAHPVDVYSTTRVGLRATGRDKL